MGSESSYQEAKSLMRKNITACRRSLGDDHLLMYRARANLARVMCPDDPQEAVAIFEDVCRRSRRVFGDAHPQYQDFQADLDIIKAELARVRAATGA